MDSLVTLFKLFSVFSKIKIPQDFIILTFSSGLTPLRHINFTGKIVSLLYVAEISFLSRFWWNDKDNRRTFFVRIYEDGNFCTISCHRKLLKDGFRESNLFHFLRTPKFVPQKSTLLTHCFFLWKPGIRNSDLCFSLRQNDEKRHYLFSKSKGPNFGPLFSFLSEVVEKIFHLCSESKGPNFGPLLYAPLK